MRKLVFAFKINFAFRLNWDGRDGWLCVWFRFPYPGTIHPHNITLWCFFDVKLNLIEFFPSKNLLSLGSGCSEQTSNWMEPEEKHEENLILLVSLGRYEEALELKLDELLIGKEILWKLSSWKWTLMFIYLQFLFYYCFITFQSIILKCAKKITLLKCDKKNFVITYRFSSTDVQRATTTTFGNAINLHKFWLNSNFLIYDYLSPSPPVASFTSSHATNERSGKEQQRWKLKAEIR